MVEAREPTINSLCKLVNIRRNDVSVVGIAEVCVGVQDGAERPSIQVLQAAGSAIEAFRARDVEVVGELVPDREIGREHQNSALSDSEGAEA